MYGYVGTMRTRPGSREDVVSIVLADVDDLCAAGCESYVVSRSDTDDDLIWVFEVWHSKAHHEASLQLPTVKAAISAAMPMLTGEFTGHELTVAGGLGVRPLSKGTAS